MTARPSLFPDWALLDQVDPTSEQNNVIEPPAAWKNYGWTYQEKPARNYVNWLGRYVANWLHYLAERVTGDESTMYMHPAYAIPGEWDLVGYNTWQAGAASKDLIFLIPLKWRAEVTEIDVKFYNHGATAAPTVTAYRASSKMAFADYAVAPSTGSTIWHNVANVTGSTWTVLTSGTLTGCVAGVGEFLIVKITSLQQYDACAGVFVTAYPPIVT